MNRPLRPRSRSVQAILAWVMALALAWVWASGPRAPGPSPGPSRTAVAAPLAVQGIGAVGEMLAAQIKPASAQRISDDRWPVGPGAALPLAGFALAGALARGAGPVAAAQSVPQGRNPLVPQPRAPPTA